MEKQICCICGKPFEGYANNPEGAMWLNEKGEVQEREFKPEERCCNECNKKYVIPGRVHRMMNLIFPK